MKIKTTEVIRRLRNKIIYQTHQLSSREKLALLKQERKKLRNRLRKKSAEQV